MNERLSPRNIHQTKRILHLAGRTKLGKLEPKPVLRMSNLKQREGYTSTMSVLVVFITTDCDDFPIYSMESPITRYFGHAPSVLQSRYICVL